jgi:TetR/AcrR family transcriptional regulator, ethionamide resistance regulator
MLESTTSHGAPKRPHTSRRCRPARLSGDRREAAILATAEALLAQRPLHKISVDDLARGAGISRSTFYFYFASKYAVVLGLFQRVASEMESGVCAFVDKQLADPARSWRLGIDALFGAFRAHRAILLAAAEAAATHHEMRVAWSTQIDKWIDHTASLIAAERERGTTPNDIPATELAIALNRMNERTLIATLTDQQPSLAHQRVVDTLSHIWISSIYGTELPAELSAEHAGGSAA